MKKINIRQFQSDTCIFAIRYKIYFRKCQQYPTGVK